MASKNSLRWLPRELQESFHLFDDVRHAIVVFRALTGRFLSEINSRVSDIYVVKQLSKSAIDAFRRSAALQAQLTKAYILNPGDKRIHRNPYNQYVAHKVDIAIGKLQQQQIHLVFAMRQQINVLLVAALNSDCFIDDAFVLVSVYNKCVNLTKTFGFGNSATICNNSFIAIYSPPSRIDIKYVLQTITAIRSERCCLNLISNVLASCQIDTAAMESESETSSIEVLKALTSHMTAVASPISGKSESHEPAMAFFDKLATGRSLNVDKPVEMTAMHGNDFLEQLIVNEENYFALILLKCLQLCPSVFDHRITKAEVVKWVNKATRGLWTQTGATLEHVLLWWCNTPLACQPVTAAKHLRDWLLNIQYDEAPETIVSLLRCLGETLTVHVVCTIWDKQFRLALIAASLPVDYKFESSEFFSTKSHTEKTTVTGQLWSELLYSLTTFCNNCDQHSTIPNELPIVEQIAVLHRLDHSIHTMRLWAASKAKSLCIDWCMELFFKVVQNDVNQCLEQIKTLRLPDLVAADLCEVEIQVNVTLRAKLVSEVKVNVCKLKLTYSECIDVLAALCKMLSLASLKLCFPEPIVWQVTELKETPNEYVGFFLEEIYLPVLRSTQTLEILNLILRIMCEAWLDHIYTQKIPFSREGALNLLRDFEGVSEWITACQFVLPEYVEILARHEVLRTCEGVGRILLRKPFEIISMTETGTYTPKVQDSQRSNDQDGEMLPPEMYVPNQQRWLELRARNRKGLNAITCICARH